MAEIIKLGGKKRPTTGAQGPTGDDWEDVTGDLTERNAYIDIIGLEGTGKTKLALSMPGPVALIDGAEKTAGIMNAVVKETGKVIRRHKYVYTLTDKKEEDQKRASEVLDALVAKYRDAYTNWARTIVFDTGNRLWELVRLSHHGVLKPKGNRMDALYGPPNAEIRGLLADEFRGQQRAHLVTIHQMGDKYIDKMVDGAMKSIRTGKFERKGGFKEVPFIANVIVECQRDENGGFQAVLRKAWFNAAVEGITINDEFMQALGYSGMNLPSILAWIADETEDKWLE